MARIIKFRAWDKELNLMCNFDLGSGQNYISLGFPVMQYTGLKDNNGVEICEGDIVLIGNWHITEIIWKLCSFRYDITYRRGYSSCIELVPDHGRAYSCMCSEKRIIGNKFKHPYLLTEKYKNGWRAFARINGVETSVGKYEKHDYDIYKNYWKSYENPELLDGK